MPEITIGSGVDAMTMGSCDHCSRRTWYQHGEIIDLRDVLAQAANLPARTPATPEPAPRPEPVGTTSACELLRSGLAPRHVVAALRKELGLDEPAAVAALRAAGRASLSMT
jgi:hypothetical protein